MFKKIKKCKNVNFRIAALIYFVSIIITRALLNTNIILNNLSVFLSAFFLFLAYQNKKIGFDKWVGNPIIKWFATVCVFSTCLWYSKHKLNFEYDIEPEYLIYSAYISAFFMAIFSCLFLYCLFVFIYANFIFINIKKTRILYLLFYTAVITIPVSYYFDDFIKNQYDDNLIPLIIFVFSLSLSIVLFLMNSLSLDKKSKKNLNKKKMNIKRFFLTIKIVSEKSFKAVEFFSIAVALFYVWIFLIKIIPVYHESFLLLDAYYKTDCNDKRDSFLYLRISDNECYKITSSGFQITSKVPFTSKKEK
ncbi:hypothetical protein AB7W42_20910 [Providencia rettgeri]